MTSYLTTKKRLSLSLIALLGIYVPWAQAQTDSSGSSPMMKMHHQMGESAAPKNLPTSDGAAPKGYDAYGVNLRLNDDPLLAKFQFDNLEWAHSSKGSVSQQWDGRFWVGHNLNKLWVRSEGAVSSGKVEEGDIEALWGHAVSPFWDMMAGIRHDIGTGPERSWAAFGFQGIAPYEYEFEATAYAGSSGRSAFRLKTSQDWLFTQKLILTPELDMNAYGKSDPARGLGSGVTDASLSFRLRYEFSRKFAPYIGYSLSRKFGDTADIAREENSPVTDHQLLIGIRAWF